MSQDDDEAPGPLQKIRASICEIVELYAQKYLDAFPQLGSFVNGVWNMLTTVGPGTREDVVGYCLTRRDESDSGTQLVSRALRFLSVVVKMGSRRDMFAAPDTLRAFCEKIILPNMSIRRESRHIGNPG